MSFDLDTVPDRDRARVAAMIPNPAIARGYVNRMVNGLEDFALLDIALEQRENVMLSGPTGSSKTSVFRAYAASRGLPFTVVECNAAMDPGTVMGRTTIDPEGGVRWVDGDFTTVVRYGGVVLIDEINMCHPRISASFHQLLAVTRRLSIPEAGETIAAGRGGLGAEQPTLFGSALNPGAGYQGMRLGFALANRFAIKLQWGYLREVEEDLVVSRHLIDMAERIRSLREIRTPMPTNVLQEFERHVGLFGWDLAAQLFVNNFAEDEQAPVARALEASATLIATELEDAAA
jgi:MoxR-like ATPase